MSVAQRTIVVAGSTTVDLFIAGADHLPTLANDGFRADNLAWCSEPLRMVVGGNGANTAFVLGRLGAPVRLFSAIGSDMLGDLMAGWLQDAGVDLSLLCRRANAATSTSAVVSDAARHQIAFHHAGAYATTTPADLPAGWDDGLGALLIASFPLLAGLRDAGYAAMLNAAKARGAITAVDIGPAIGQPATLDEMRPLLPLVDYLIGNEHELAVFAGSVDDAVAASLAGGARHVIVKRGPAGAGVHSAAGACDVPALRVAVRQTVGAGDAFDAGLLWALVNGYDSAAAVRWGHATAAGVVMAENGVLGAPDTSQVAALLGDIP